MALRSKRDLPAELAQQGITQDLLRQVVVFGERHGRDTAVAVDPSNYAGVNAHAMRVRSLATSFGPLGWRRRDVHGQSWITSPDERHAICTCSGDERTGLPGYPYPKAAHQRGKVSKKSTLNNADQLELPGVVSLRTATTLQEKDAYVWVLLVHRVSFDDSLNPGEVVSQRPDEVRYELSLPTSFENDNFVDFVYREWLDTVVLEDVSADNDPTPGSDDDQDDISITRK